MKQLTFFAILVFAGLVSGIHAQSLETAQYFNHGIRSLERSGPAKALEYFNRSLDSAERSHTSPQFRAKIHYNIGVSLFRLGRYANAVGHYDKAIKLAGGSYEKAAHALKAARKKIEHTVVPPDNEVPALTRAQ